MGLAEEYPSFDEPSFEALLPEATSAELILVQSVLSDPTGASWKMVEKTPLQAFSDPVCIAFWRAFLAGVQVDDPVGLMAATRLPVQTFLAVASVDPSRGWVTAATIEIYAKQLTDTWRKKRSDEIAAQLEKGGDLARIRDQLDELINDGAPAKLIAKDPGEFLPIRNDDASVVLGNRYLNLGDTGFLVSSSGMGKSSMSIQASVSWALGRDFLGIKPNGKIKTLIFQSEDGDGDIWETFSCIRHALNLSEKEWAEVRKNIRIVTDRIHRGKSLFAEIKRQAAIFGPRMVILNPLMAFMEGDPSSAEDAGRFFRDGLNALNEPATFASLIVHHTSKPPKEKVARNWNEVMYDMFGSSDLTNFARAIISLRACEEEGKFVLALAKRGKRAGVTKQVPQGTGYRAEIVTQIPVGYSNEWMTLETGDRVPLIHWVEREFDEEEKPQPKKPGRKPKTIQYFIDAIPVGEKNAKNFNEIFRMVEQLFPGTKKTAFAELLKENIDEGGLVHRRMAAGGFCYWVL